MMHFEIIFAYKNVVKSEFKMKVLFIKDNNEIFFNDRGKMKNQNVEMVKRDIRNRFNPKFKDLDKQIFPLKKGVSHNHIIHGSDLPNEYNIIEKIISKYKK